MRKRDQERMIRRYLKWSSSQWTPRGCLLMVIFGLIFWAYVMITTKDTSGIATPTAEVPMGTPAKPNAPAKTPNAPAKKPTPTKKPAASGAPTSTAAYDERGLVDGGIPGAPPGWKPVPIPPAPNP